MKRSKWLKWKMGGGVVFALAMLFQSAKADPAFEAAHERALQAQIDSDEPEDAADDDQVMNEGEQGNLPEDAERIGVTDTHTVEAATNLSQGRSPAAESPAAAMEGKQQMSAAPAASTNSARKQASGSSRAASPKGKAAHPSLPVKKPNSGSPSPQPSPIPPDIAGSAVGPQAPVPPDIPSQPLPAPPDIPAQPSPAPAVPSTVPAPPTVTETNDGNSQVAETQPAEEQDSGSSAHRSSDSRPEKRKKSHTKSRRS
ncbi:hypothetical protein G3578_12160 [Brevibacillus sp. SYP-B805]|uniref:hypothetical protein n=1 Tax=Brevibacillus sp. SYP-B805 TaxID=1578199 RepID=UPI0013EB91C3|nr:hypothetical protein [Brevibacillus sp. SYP-B805]NGQ95910.1 hypothetical protein [Brevibacillus sp. SYP-B805]